MMGSLRCLFTMHVKMLFNRTEDPQDERRATLSESLFESGFACPGPTLKKRQPLSRLYMQIPTAILSRLKCDIKLHPVKTQEEISLLGCMLQPTHQKLCRTLQSLRKLSVCLWKFDMHVCAWLIPQFSSVFCLL